MNEDARTGFEVGEIKRDLVENLFYLQGKFPEVATQHDWYVAVAYTVRDRLLNQWVKSAQSYYEHKARTVCYLSAEFLIGPQLGMNLLRLNSYDAFREATRELGLNLDDLIEHEEEPGIRNGWQAEVADSWLSLGNPWEIAKPETRFDVKFGGRTEVSRDAEGRYRVKWIPQHVVQGTPYDTAILGFGVESANLLRLWKAQAHMSFDFQAFNHGDYYGAVHDKVDDENITKVLYPNDEAVQGRELRLKQQYFLVSCSLQDMIRLYLQREKTLDGFHKKFAVQLNDTHPSLAIPELMRLLVDQYLLGWDAAWDITQRTFGYTNHTLLPEALERWPVDLIARLLPRHLEIIYEINSRFLNEVRHKFPNDEARVPWLSLIDEAGGRYVRMAHLACVGSHAI